MAEKIVKDSQCLVNDLVNDTISRQAAVEVIDAVFPVDPMKSEYAQGIACGAALAKIYVEQLPSAQPEQRWISCSERMPEDDVEVFVYLFERQTPYIAWVEDCRWYTEDFEVEKENCPTAWMPLPEPYKEVE